jgi:hypothetical protein
MGCAMRKEHLILLAVNLALILGFGSLFMAPRNYEFILYVGVVVVFLGLIAVTVIVPQSEVGGYLNTSLDLCSDLIGALLVLDYIHIRYLPLEDRP